MSLNLPITVVAIDNVAHELTRLALEDTLKQITPTQVLILTDDPAKIRIAGADYVHFDGGKNDVMRTLWYQVPELVRADHLLWLQWDSWVIDARLWISEFLNHDYIGAPFPVEPKNVWDMLGYFYGYNVGNGGFSIRSTRLMRHLADNREKYPIQVPAEDDAICRWHRLWLERDGFCWASPVLAARFSFEIGPEVIAGSVFGFHGVYNWLWVLDHEQRAARIAVASPFVKDKSGFKQVLEMHDLVPSPPDPGVVVRFW